MKNLVKPKITLVGTESTQSPNIMESLSPNLNRKPKLMMNSGSLTPTTHEVAKSSKTAFITTSNLNYKMKHLENKDLQFLLSNESDSVKRKKPSPQKLIPGKPMRIDEFFENEVSLKTRNTFRAPAKVKSYKPYSQLKSDR